MINMNLVEIKTFSNLTEAAEYILKEGKSQVSLSSIRKTIEFCCHGRAKTAYGYVFKYIKEVNKNASCKHRYYEIIQTDLNDNFIAMYSSCAEAARAVNGLCQSIRRCCVGLKKTYKNSKWKFGTEIQHGACCRSILQIETLTGKVIKKWASITEAANVTGINKVSIGYVCRGKRKSAGGFGWRYADEEELAA